MPSSASRPGLGPAFRNLWSATLASNLGDGVVATATPLLAARLTSDPLLIAGISALAMLPWLVFAIPSGIAIDRMDRRRALAIAQAVRVALSLLVIGLVATDSLTIWWLYLVVFVYGMFETLYDGAVRSMPPSLVPTAELQRANGLIEAGEQVMQNFIARPLTSALFAVSVVIPLSLNAVVFALAGVMALLLPAAASGRRDEIEELVPWHRQLADGWTFIAGDRMLRRLLIVSTGIGVMTQLAFASVVLYVLGPLGVPEALFGVFLLSGAVGAIVGSLATSGLKRRFGTGPVAAVAVVLTGAAIAGVGIVSNVWTAALLYLLLSGGVLTWNVLIMSLRQAAIPIRLFGRVQGTWRAVLWGAMPLGSLLGGLVARVDLGLPFVVGGAGVVLIGIVFFGFFRGLPDPEDMVPE